ncbi:serine/threonine-protein kinase [Mycobacterium sp. UM_Kg1]|uniref:serine/threonine-protein kinase n=1 Tax=Mycobacterium sp. UM_Kg1 TaxID=1545691 RepID=UPI00061B4550|nr:serine/threonine-protein kinase [Mycobacterium sp. UM_Kg1]
MDETASGSRAGSRLGPYLLKRLLGRGSTGKVYEAFDTRRGRTAALKLLAPALCGPALREWLRREALVAGRVQEPHVVPVRDYGELDGRVYLDMPLVAGTDLAALLKRTGVLSPPRAVNVVWQAASALDAAHSAGVLHRGVRPRNILVTDDDFVYLVDFALAGAPGAEAVEQAAGWKYAAPELFSGSEFGPAADVYALTCVLYQCLTGTPPYRADNPAALAHAHQSKPIPRPSRAGAAIPEALDEVIAKGMAKEPQSRYSGAAELATAAYQALSTPDQPQTVQLYESSQQATPPLVDQPEPGAAATSEALVSEAPVSSAAPAEPSSSPDLAEAAEPPAPAADVPAADVPEAVPAAAPAAPPRTAAGDDWLRSPRRPCRPGRLTTRPLVLWVAAALVVAVVGLTTWLTNRPASDGGGVAGSTSGSATEAGLAPTTASQAEAQDRLFKLLPPGYPQGTCKAAAPSNGAIAEVTCGRNVDVDGPPTATYTLFRDIVALRVSFDDTVQATNVVTCPGRIQSPGAWHRTATPDKTAGTLLCGTRNGSAVLVWTNDANLVIGSLRAERNTPTLEQFYSWWSSHS